MNHDVDDTICSARRCVTAGVALRVRCVDVVKLMMLTVLLFAIPHGKALAQTYPNGPIRFIVPYAAGGSTTNVARLVGQKLNDAWGQPVVIDNRPGGNTIIGTEAVMKAGPNGYTILLGTSSHVLIPLLTPAPFDPIRDFAPVAIIGVTETILLVNPNVRATTLQEFIALAKAQPGRINYATGGSGSATHLASELFNGMAGVSTRHIPYKGAAPALIDLIGGQVEMSFAIPSSGIQHVQGGRLRALAVTGEKRLAALPNVPTFAQAGLPGFEMNQWYGVLAPAGTPRDVITKLNTEIAKIVAMPDVRERLVAQGMEPYSVSPEQLGATMNRESTKFARIIRDASIKIEN